jgi:ribosome-binding protein aMBF1 (putative translation factor)
LDYPIFDLYAYYVAFANAMEKSIHSARYAVFLQVLREARERAGLTQVQLAKKIGETQTFVSKCERGERRLDVIELRAFCKGFGLKLHQFIAALERALANHRAN